MAEGAPWIELHLKISLGTLALEADLVSKRHAVAVVGPSGSGKSTLLRVLAGVERGASGVFRPPWARGVGWVPQDALLFPHLNVSENLAYSGAPRTRVQEMARLLSVDALLDRRPRRLSGGEQQRVALGRALLSEPGLLLLDEPFSALDRPLRAQVAERVRTFCSEREVPVLLVSHDERDAQALAEEQWLVEDGRLQRL